MILTKSNRPKLPLKQGKNKGNSKITNIIIYIISSFTFPSA